MVVNDEVALKSQDLATRCIGMLQRQPAGLITDIDGTISAIAGRPSEAVVTETARSALARLRERLAFVGIVTGRSAADGARMVDVPGLAYVGNHGMEQLVGEQTRVHPGAAASVAAVTAALAEIEREAEVEGRAEDIVVENKRLSGSIHFRLAPDPVATRAAVLRLASAAAAKYGLLITEGRMIVELRPNLVVNKGTAIAEIVEQHGLHSVLFLGDDVTDVDGFRAVRRLREDGNVEGLRIAVVAPDTQPIVLTEADATVDGVEECVELLTAIAAALPALEA